MRRSIGRIHNGLASGWRRLSILFLASAFIFLALGDRSYAAPSNTPFLNVDINGGTGPAQTTYPAGWLDPWLSWDFQTTPATNTFSNTFGSVDVTLTAINYESFLPQSRDRSGPDGGNDTFLSNMYEDFVLISHSNSVGLGWDYFEIMFSGLNVETEYEITVWNYDENHYGDQAGKFMAWGIDDPNGYDTYSPGEVPNASYLARAPMAGNRPSDPNVDDAYYYSGSFNVTTDISGDFTIYGWADLNSWDGTHQALLNGFAVGVSDFVWEGDAGNNGGTAANWQGGSAPSGSLGYALAFGNLDTGDQTVDNFNETCTDVSGIRFAGAGGGYTINGSGSISLDSGAAVGGSSGYAHTMNVDLISNGAGGIVFNNTDDLTIGGVISTGVAGGGITLSGNSTLTLNGANTYTGGATMSTGTIVLGHNTALGTGTLTISGGDGALQSDNDARSVSNAVSIDNTRTLTVSGSNNLALGGVISGAGSLTKEGTGTLALSGTNTYTGLTTLSAGTLNLSGQLYGDVTLNGGTFMGAGTIANGGSLTLNSGSVFAPGNSIGTTVITGDYVQNAGSTLEVEVFKDVDSSLSSDLLDVSGTATLESGSTISVTDLTSTGQYIDTGDIFTIITTGSGVTDNGATVTDTSASLSFTGSVSGDDYILTAARSAFGGLGVGRNNVSLLGAIDSDAGSASGDYLTVINELSGLGATALNSAASQLSPLMHSGMAEFKGAMVREMSFDMAGYLGARRRNEEYLPDFATLRQSNLLLADASPNPDTLAYVINRAERLKERQAGFGEETHSFFRPYGVLFDQDSTSEFIGFRARALGARFGTDQMFGDNWIVGLGGAYSHSFMDFDGGVGTGDIDSFRLGPYASYFGEEFYLDGSISFGYHLNRTRREIEFGGIDRTAKADYDAYDISAYAGTGLDIKAGQWTLSPEVTAQYTCYRNEDFEESGAGAAGLDVDARTQQSLLARLGVRIYTVATFETMKIAPELFVGYSRELMDDEDIESSFVDGAARFTTEVDSNRDDSVYYGAGLSVLLRENVSTYVRYEGESYSGSSINSLHFGITVRF